MSFLDDIDNATPTAINSPPSEDGCYEIVMNLIDNPEKPNQALYGCVVVAPAKFAGHSWVKNLNDADNLTAQGKEAGARLTTSEWKSLIISAGVDIAKVKKTKSFRDLAALFHNVKAYVYFVPDVLTKKGEYADVSFITKEKYLAGIESNGQLLATKGAKARPAASGGTAKKVDLTDI